MSSQVEHTDVGAYALGLLEPGDRRAFEAHLRGCGACQAELRALSGTAGALFELGGGPGEAGPEAGEDEPSAPPAPVIDMMRRKRRHDRRLRRGAYVIGAAAAGVALAAGVGLGTVLDDEGTPAKQPPVQALTGERFQATNAGTGASGTVGLVDKGWGTQVSLELRGIKGPLRCHLEAVARDGERSVVAGWRVPDKGYGVPGQPKPLTMQGGTGLTRQEISRFEVRLDGGGTLLTIPL
ncbi:anti-sigma factor family protein [Actinomadura madurae]|uniref:anti-sigma factor family protein n=1 Tax=Actinomadura madurae TaxID=1993 RepID=UPI0020275DC9|nr:zf-HC2 domain-containing protein [Actinomadura madurae]MCP9954048.1 zf-HC2 domain-containing protein [Actinomadura madurae]MCP9970789.1 zf-HC2 domain-containing protein [Actinomadura madurae]MCP9983270.1 zf-HC2 domain-containing protein [Actinomadura madurae]MCQ0005172.1 zf-HC2 domain-containing protein [Actinomadura madurae]MCQ0019517.1 zf-HC2 domain-containing protein [Actinomadura madurae]